MPYIGTRTFMVDPGDTVLEAIVRPITEATGRDDIDVLKAIALSNRGINLDHILPGQVIVVPDPLFEPLEVEPEPPVAEPEPEPEPEPPTDPEPPLEVNMGVPWRAEALRTAARPPSELLEAHADTFGRPHLTLDLIGGAWDPWQDPKKGHISPAASADWWNPQGKNYVLDTMIELAIAAGYKGSDILISVAFPLGLRGDPAGGPKNTNGATRCRNRFLEIIEGDHIWGARNAAKRDKPYIGDVGNDAIRTPLAAARACLEHIRAKYGDEHVPTVTWRQAWECFGFSVFPWTSAGVLTGRTVTAADGIYTSSGMLIEEHHGAKFHRDGAQDEFVAAYMHQGDIITREFGMSLTMCGDKRALDVMEDGPYAGDVVSDILAAQLGSYVAQSGPGAQWGADWYVKQNEGQDSFDQRHAPGLDLVRHQARTIGVPFAINELGVGDGTEETKDDDADDTTQATDMLERYFDTVPSSEFGQIVRYHPMRNGHGLGLGMPNRRNWLLEELGAVKRPGVLYESEL